ncbi:nuclear transport factor 2 family protein [Marinicella litoralis]|nr:hypothetical protein [Marinicella litoralis]
MPTINRIFISTVMLVTASLALAAPSQELIQSFVTAISAANQPTTTEDDLKHYFTFMTDDVTDFHAAYGVTMSGKEGPMKNMLKNVANKRSFKVNLSDVILGSDTAVMVLNEESVYLKNGQTKNFKGRTLWVLEFNEHDKIKHIRRYLDWY